MTDNNQPPPQDTFERCTTHTAFRLHPGEPWRAVADEGAAIRVETDHAVHRFDRIIVATGLDYDLALRPELSAHTPHIATWADRLPEAAASDNVQLRRMPYLGPGYEFTPRVPGTAEWLGRVTNFTFGAQLSLGPSARPCPASNTACAAWSTASSAGSGRRTARHVRRLRRLRRSRN